jgi:hypothetical protein
MVRERSVSGAVIVSVAAWGLCACSLGDGGDPPPHREMYFPTALVVSGDGADADDAPDHLFIANSNFDLRYVAGTVLGLDLAAVDREIARCQSCLVDTCEPRDTECRAACAADTVGGSSGASDCRDGCREGACLAPASDAGTSAEDACDACLAACDNCLDACDDALDACRRDDCAYDEGTCFVDPSDDDVFAGEVRVGSFATALSLAQNGRRIFVATRTDDHITTVPVRDTAGGGRALACPASTPACGVASTRPAEPTDRLPSWPGDPTDLHVGRLSAWAEEEVDGEYVMVAHRLGAVSLFVEQAGSSEPGFMLVDTLTPFPSTLPGIVQLTGLERDPGSGLVHTSLLWNTAGGPGTRLALGRIGMDLDLATSGAVERALLYDAGLLLFDGLAGLTQTRALTFVGATDGANPDVGGAQALVVAEAPTSLLFVDVDPGGDDGDRARVSRATEVGSGASHVVAGVLGAPGSPEQVRVALVSCFDAREVYVVDLDSGLVRSVVRNLSGPFRLALDGPRARLYVADFRSSIVRVLDLAPVMRATADAETSARLIATIGRPRVVQELQ